MTDIRFPLPAPSLRTTLAVIGIVCLLVVPTGAVLFNELDLIGPDEDVALQPHEGPNGGYATIDADRQLTINVTDAGVNPDARTDIKRVFVVTNVGEEPRRVWLTHTNEHAIAFYDDSTGRPITEADETTLEPDEQIVVSLRVDTTDPSVNAGDVLVTKLYVHTVRAADSAPRLDAPESVAFGDVTTGATATEEVPVRNAGNSSLTISSLTIGGADAESFTLINAEDSRSLSPGESTNLTVRFAPTTAGGKSATLELATNEPGTPNHTVSLSGVGRRPDVTILGESPLDFGSVDLGQTASETVTVRNDGASPVTVGSISVTGGRSGEFGVEAADVPVRLSPGETHEFAITYAPTTTGPAEATLVVATGGDPAQTAETTLRGRGDLAEILVEPSAIDFGGVGTGKRANATVTLTSTGTVPVRLDDFGFGGADPDQFSVETGSAPEVLPPGESASVTVRFEPTDAGNFSAVLTLDSNATATPTTTVPVEGTGLAADIGVGDDNLDFGNVTVGSSRTLNVTVWNEEDSPTDLHVRHAFIVGSNPEAFEITDGNPPFTLEPGEERDIEVTYSPDTAGIKTAQLRILSDAGNSPQIDVWMSNAGWRIRVQEVAARSRGVDGDEEDYAMDPSSVNEDSVRVEVDANDIPEGTWLDVNISQPRTRTAPAGMDNVRLKAERGGSFDMNFIQNREPPTADADPYSAPTDRDVVQYVTLWHSIPNEDFSSPTLTYRVKRSSLPSDVAPEDVVFRRFADGEWNRHEATLLRETTDHYVYAVDLPGLSQFVITAPNGSSPTDRPGSPGGDGDDDGDGRENETETPPEDDDEPAGPTVDRGDVSITFPEIENGTTPRGNVSVRELPVPAPGSDSRDGPKANISAGIQGAGANGESVVVGEDGVSFTVSNDESATERIRLEGADAMAIVDEPISLTGSHSLFGSKESIDDHWQMVRRVEITVPTEYEDRPATVRIRVPVERFHSTDPEDATIARQHGGWQLLETSVVNRTEEFVVLEADTPGFSVFAVFADNEVSYTWDVETYDEPLSGVNVEPTFDDVGIYNVTLTVSDSFGITDTTRYRILANDVPAVEIERAGPVAPNESTTLVATVNDEYGNVTVTWTFPDGTVATGRTANYTFGPGDQTVQVVAEDEFGARGTTERRFAVGGLSGLADAVERTLSSGWGLLVAVLAVLLVLLARRLGLLALPPNHAPEIARVEHPVFRIDGERVVIPRLELTDRGGDLETFEVSLLDGEGRVLARGPGAIDGGRAFDATSVVLETTTETAFDREGTYAVGVTVTDEAGNETTEAFPLSVDPFIYDSDEETPSLES